MKRNLLKLPLCGAICFLSSISSLSAQKLSDDMVHKAAAPLIDNKVVDGISIGYIQGDRYGTVHLGHTAIGGEEANNNTLYEIGSISKVFTGLLLADAVVRGEITLGTAANVDNSAKLKLPSHDDRSITWLNLSTHRSGLPRLPSNMDATSLTNPYALYDSQKAAEAQADLKLTYSPGQSQEYSNFAVSVLGYLIRENAGKSYQELLQERIAEPLGMSDCTVSPSDEQKQRHATPHDSVGSPTSDWTFADLPGAGGVRASMKDMMRFARAQLKPPKGKFGEAIKLAWKQHTEADDSGAAMGLGWMIMDDVETRWHNGQTGGSHSMLLVNRQKSLAIIVLCNTASLHVDPFAFQLMQEATGNELAEASGEELGSDTVAPKISPFTSVGFFKNMVFVGYKGKTFLWQEIDGIPVAQVVAASKKHYGERWKKRIREDLVEVLWKLDHRPSKTVELRLQDFKTKKETVVAKAPMTKANRDLLRREQRQVEKAAAVEKKNAKPNLPIDAEHRARLVGKYKLNPNFIFDVQDHDGHLMVGITNQPTQEVFPDSATHWSYRSVKATLEFKLAKKGPAKSLVLHQNGIKQTAKRMKK